MLRSYLTIIAVVGLVFLIALYCHLTGSDDALDEIADGDGSSLPDFTPFHGERR